MPVYFLTINDINKHLSLLDTELCSTCLKLGTLKRHGFIHQFISPQKHSIRAWRIICKKDKYHNGCGGSFNIRLADSFARFSFTALQLWKFVSGLLDAVSIKKAWEQSGAAFSLQNAYRLRKRFEKCLSVIRTSLCSRAPPPEKENAGGNSVWTLQHLIKIFGNANPISRYQSSFQKCFLALS